MLVIDSSAVIARLTARPPVEGLAARLAADDDWHAPHLIDLEVLSVLRRLAAAGLLAADRVEDARTDFQALRIQRYPHVGLRDRVWELRHNVTAYDAAYLALSEALEAPLVTLDGRLGGAPGHQARVELFHVPDGE